MVIISIKMIHTIVGGCKMKVRLKYPMRSFAGLNSDKTLVYRSCWNNVVFIASKYTCPRITEHNHRQGTKLTRANALYKSINTAFIEDLKIYAEAYNKKYSKKKRLPSNFYNIFIKALCNGAVKINDLDSLEKFVGLHGNTIEAWIANGLLPKVKAKFIGIAVWEPIKVEYLKEKVAIASENIPSKSLLLYNRVHAYYYILAFFNNYKKKRDYERILSPP